MAYFSHQFLQNQTVSMDELSQAIIDGSLKGLKSHLVKGFDINRFLTPEILIHPIPSVSGITICPSIRGPTILILAILCERPDFVKFILSFDPDLSIKVNGYNALHYSALTKDYHCLKILLTCKFYQDFIAVPISEIGLSLSTTNSLHIAVSNNNLISASLLLEELPNPRNYSENAQKISQNATLLNEDSISDDELSDHYTAISGIDVNSVTTQLSTPLHIATYMQNVNMCRLLLSYDADTTKKNAKGQTPIDIALNLKLKVGKQILQILQNPPNESPTNILNEVASHNEESKKLLTSNTNEGSEESDSEVQETHLNAGKDTTEILLKQLLKQVSLLNARLDSVENQIQSPNPNPTSVRVLQDHACFHCESIETTQCSICHEFYCSKCFHNPFFHSCI